MALPYGETPDKLRGNTSPVFWYFLTAVSSRLIFTSDEVVFSSALVSLFVSRTAQKLLSQFSQKKFDGKVANGPRKKPVDFDDNPGHVTSGLESGLGCD